MGDDGKDFKQYPESQFPRDLDRLSTGVRAARSHAGQPRPVRATRLLLCRLARFSPRTAGLQPDRHPARLVGKDRGGGQVDPAAVPDPVRLAEHVDRAVDPRRQVSRPSTSISSKRPGPPPTPVQARRNGWTRSPSLSPVRVGPRPAPRGAGLRVEGGEDHPGREGARAQIRAARPSIASGPSPDRRWSGPRRTMPPPPG